MRNYTGLLQRPILMVRMLHGHLSQSQSGITQLQVGTSKEKNIVMPMPLSSTNTMRGTVLLQLRGQSQEAGFMPLSVLLTDTPEWFLEFHKELFIVLLYYFSITKVFVISSFPLQPYILLHHGGYL